MREIKVRGYAAEEMVNDQWLYGTGVYKIVFTDEYALKTGVKEEWFIFTEYGWVQVEPKSIGQYTGLRDINSEETFEGHIVESNWGYRFPIYFEDGCYKTESEDFEIINENQINYYGLKVVGNLFEHPHLLEVAE